MNPPVEAAPQRHPAIELLARYRAIFQASWAARRELAGPKRLADEAAFLPAALSLQETPAHPAPRRAALAVCALFVAALVWASVVKRVLVKNGDAVQAGQVLVELDATHARADQANVREQLAVVVSEERRSSSLAKALRDAKPPVLPPLPLGELGA